MMGSAPPTRLRHFRAHPVIAHRAASVPPGARPVVAAPPDEKSRVICPFCDGDDVVGVRRNGVGDQLVVFRCNGCHREWPEIDPKGDDHE